MNFKYTNMQLLNEGDESSITIKFHSQKNVYKSSNIFFDSVISS